MLSLDIICLSLVQLKHSLSQSGQPIIPCAPLLSLNDSTVMIAAAELLAYN